MKSITNECIIRWNETNAIIQFPGYSYPVSPHSNLITDLSNIRKECIRKGMLGMMKDNIVFSIHYPCTIDLDRHGMFWPREDEPMYSMSIDVGKLFDMVFPKVYEYMSEHGKDPHTIIIGKKMQEAMTKGTLADFRFRIFKQGVPKIIYIPGEEGIIAIGDEY